MSQDSNSKDKPFTGTLRLPVEVNKIPWGGPQVVYNRFHYVDGLLMKVTPDKVDDFREN
jgi:hypothetical protein